MNRFSKASVLVLAFLLMGNLLVAGAKTAVAQGMGVSLAPAQSEAGKPACWVAVGNKLYFVEKDETTILKVKASAAF